MKEQGVPNSQHTPGLKKKLGFLSYIKTETCVFVQGTVHKGLRSGVTFNNEEREATQLSFW